MHVTLEDPQPGLSLVICTDAACDADDADATVRVTGASETGWSVDWFSGDELVYVLVDEASTVVTRDRAPLEWERVDGSAECGGPQVATLTIEA